MIDLWCFQEPSNGSGQSYSSFVLSDSLLSAIDSCQSLRSLVRCLTWAKCCVQPSHGEQCCGCEDATVLVQCLWSTESSRPWRKSFRHRTAVCQDFHLHRTRVQCTEVVRQHWYRMSEQHLDVVEDRCRMTRIKSLGMALQIAGFYLHSQRSFFKESINIRNWSTDLDRDLRSLPLAAHNKLITWVVSTLVLKYPR